MIFLNFLLSESWFCTLSRGHIDASWFDHQKLWLSSMLPISSSIYTMFLIRYISTLETPQHHVRSRRPFRKSVKHDSISLMAINRRTNRQNCFLSIGFISRLSDIIWPNCALCEKGMKLGTYKKHHVGYFKGQWRSRLSHVDYGKHCTNWPPLSKVCNICQYVNTLRMP